jgi:hypothetical protein
LHARMQWRVLTAGWEAPVRRKKAKRVCVRALDSLAKAEDQAPRQVPQV